MTKNTQFQNKKRKKPLEISNADSLSHLPRAAELSLVDLFESIDRIAQTRYADFCAELLPQLKIAIARCSLSLSQIAAASAVEESVIDRLFSASPEIPDIDQMARISQVTGAQLHLCLISRKEKSRELHCDEQLSKAGQLEAFLRERISDLDVHPIAKQVFVHCGLQAAPGLDGGSIEKAVPQLFRLMRLSMFMRCKLVLSVTLPRDANSQMKFDPAA